MAGRADKSAGICKANFQFKRLDNPANPLPKVIYVEGCNTGLGAKRRAETAPTKLTAAAADNHNAGEARLSVMLINAVTMNGVKVPKMPLAKLKMIA